MANLFFVFFVTMCFIASAFGEESLVFLITGCSSGIGRATALAISAYSSQYKVFATMRKPAAWTEEERDNLGVLAMDVTSDKSVKAAIDTVIKAVGRIDVLINNAGVGMAGTSEMVSVDEAKNLFDTNVWGVVRVLQAVLPHMRKARSGYVINLSSTAGMRGVPGMDIYSGSKFALEGITDSLRYSLAPYNVAITNVNAGPVRTNFTEVVSSALNSGKGYLQVVDDTQYLRYLAGAMVDNLNRRMESDEAQSPEDIAQVIINLVVNKKHSRNLFDVPFNIGTSEHSQRVIEMVRKHPTGWGGIYTTILSSMPQPPMSPQQKAAAAAAAAAKAAAEAEEEEL